MQPNYTYHATVVRIVDGDTLDVDLDYGDHLHQQRRLRLQGIDAYEHGTELGDQATALLASMCPVGAQIVVTTSKPDKYGRQLAVVQDPMGQDVAVELLKRELARPYLGGRKPA